MGFQVRAPITLAPQRARKYLHSEESLLPGMDRSAMGAIFDIHGNITSALYFYFCIIHSDEALACEQAGSWEGWPGVQTTSQQHTKIETALLSDGAQ